MVDQPPARATKFTETTLLPVSIVSVMLISGITFSWRLSAAYTSLDEKVGRIEKSISDGQAQAVTERDLRLWLMLLRDRNKTIDVPEWVK